MTLKYAHESEYFFFAQLLVHHVERYIDKHPDARDAIFDLRDIYDLFRQDFASTTTNLEAILNVADEYRVETLNGDQKLISHYAIDPKNNSLQLDFNADALSSLKQGKSLIEPDATSHE